jgi:sugar transferase (PEP-CTERM/EpsH1 system associated)
MKILYLCHRIPYPPDKGDKIRAFHQIRAMAARHEVDVFTLADDARDLSHAGALEQFCHSVTVARINPKLARLRALPYLFSKQPLTIPYFYSADLAAAVRKALSNRYDLIFVYCSAMAQYVSDAEGPPIVMDFVDVDSDKWTQYAGFSPFPFSAVYRREGGALREYEKRACARASCVVVTTEREARLLYEIAPGAHVQVIPNGVDTDYFDPAVQPATGAPGIIFTGDMSYFPNEQAVCFFAREVLPIVRRSIAGARFLIVGRNPGRAVRALGRLDGVEVTGFVPDVRTYLARAQAAVAPFQIAAGIQNKILEAMAYGLPVVATPRAVQGLRPGVRALVETGETAEELAAKLGLLLRDPELAAKRGRECRLQVSQEYRWACALDRLLQLLENSAGAEDGIGVQGALGS